MSKKRPMKYRTTRGQFKAVKRYDHAQFDQFCTLMYEQGYEDGKKAVKGIGFDALMETIGTVKGIGESRMTKIKELVAEKYGINVGDENG